MAPPVDLVLVQPFELKVEPAKLELEPGAKAMLKVTATRKGGYAGPITLEVQNLPALVTAPKVTLEKDQTEAEIEVTAGDKAQPVEKNDVKIQGTATAASNVQNPSGNFQVKVAKK